MLLTLTDTINKINSGKRLLLAGDETLLRQLPTGHWIGGTTPYFMTAEKGGIESTTHLFANEIPAFAENCHILTYAEDQLRLISADAPDNGFSVIIIPYASPAHFFYAQQAPSFPNLFAKPIVGWVAGVHLTQLGQLTPKVFNGKTGEMFDQHAVVMHVTLPFEKMAIIQTVNPFEPDLGDQITFDTEGFEVTDCLIEGQLQNFAEYLLEQQIDTRLPLIAKNALGMRINVAIQHLDTTAKRVRFYAPVFKGVNYRFAAPLEDYISGFKEEIVLHYVDTPVFACNCVLNYTYLNLEGKRTGSLVGPMTFGEIAYQLVTQTLVYLDIGDS